MPRYRDEGEMRLLNEFAKVAMGGLITSYGVNRPTHPKLAHEAYEIAEAMLGEHIRIESTPRHK